MPVVTPTEARDFLRGLAQESDATVDLLVSAADVLLASWLGWSAPDGAFAPTMMVSAFTEYHDAPMHGDSSRLVLRVGPVRSVTSMHTDPTGMYTGEETEILAADRVLRGGCIRTRYSMPSNEDGIRVVYQAGFNDGAVPENVRTAALLCVRELWIKRMVFDLPNWHTGPISLPVITPEIKTLLRRWMSLGVAHA